MNEPTDQQVIEILAKREGYEWKVSGSDPYEDGYCWHDKEGKFPVYLPPYLKSLDALAPILATLTEEEWIKYLACLPDAAGVNMSSKVWEYQKAVMTLKPRQLALCICKAIGGGE